MLDQCMIKLNKYLVKRKSEMNIDNFVDKFEKALYNGRVRDFNYVRR